MEKEEENIRKDEIRIEEKRKRNRDKEWKEDGTKEEKRRIYKKGTKWIRK